MKVRSPSSLAAYVVLLVAYAGAFAISRIGRTLPRRRRALTHRLVVTGTFYSSNWFASHARPLAAAGLDRVIVVADAPQPAPPGVVFLCPPHWVRVCAGRALAKTLWLFLAGWRYDPDIFMGFHLVPGAIGALIVARCFGRAACYQMTGGPIEIVGGGNGSENSVTRRLGRPSAFLEGWAMRVAGEFDLVVVRGTSAKTFLADRSCRSSVRIITGSIPSTSNRPLAERLYDLAFVGRLASMKQPEQFVEIVARVAADMPAVRAVVAGDGPELPALKTLARNRNVEGNIEFLGHCDDVMAILSRSKILLLTSRSEGLSIALAEAMGAGVPGVCADVGDLGDVVQSGENGFLVPPNDLDAYVAQVKAILRDEVLWSRLSGRANAAAVSHFTVDAVAARWRQCLTDVSTNGAARLAVSA